jgi:hypothetical protein
MLGTAVRKAVDGDSTIRKPIKTFIHHHFPDYLASLISQHEHLMDKACDDLRASLDDPPHPFVTDVFEAQFMRMFEGLKPGTLFIKGGSKGRYVFAVNVDFFNVEDMRIRGASTSCGIISTACLHLPLSIRYKPENMYLIIIPGPHEPHLAELNHYLHPLMDDMVISWERPSFFSNAIMPKGSHQPMCHCCHCL